MAALGYTISQTIKQQKTYFLIQLDEEEDSGLCYCKGMGGSKSNKKNQLDEILSIVCVCGKYYFYIFFIMVYYFIQPLDHEILPFM